MKSMVAQVARPNHSVWLALLVSWCVGICSAGAAPSVELSWDANTEPDLAGYRVYSGSASGSHTLLADVGKVTSTTVTNLHEGSTVYFVVTAYNTSNLESPPSTEVSYTAPAAPVVTPDTLAPTLTCPPNLMVAAMSASGAVVAYPAPKVTDAVDPNPTVTCIPASGSLFPVGNTTVTCTATDASGNKATCSFIISVKDGVSPVVTCPANMVVAAVSASGAVVFYPAPTVVDSSDPNPKVTSSPASGSTFPIGTTTVTCTAVDASGNVGSSSFTITVKDSTAPVLTCPANMTVAATSASGAVATYTAPTAKDTVDLAPKVTSTPASGSTFPLGTTTVTCTATDASGNTAASSFTITVKDITAPVLTCPANLTVAAASASGAVVNYPAPTAKDAVDPAPKVTSTPASGSTYPMGITKVTCTATDASGNSYSSYFTITVQDSGSPILTCPPNMTVAATSASGAVVTYPAPTAKDSTDPNPKVASTPPSGSLFPIGTTTVTCTATDITGNTSTASFTITVQDLTAPVLVCPANMTVAPASPSGAVVTYASPTAADTVDPSPKITSSPASGSLFPIGTTTVTCTAIDASGNTATGSFTITVKDSTSPVLTCPANMTVAASSAGGAVVNYPAPTATDSMDPNPKVTSSPASGSAFPIGITTVTCAAIDASGNIATCSFTITVKDTTAPVLSVPANMTVAATSASGAVVVYAAPTATDVVDPSPKVTSTPLSGSAFPIGTTTVTCKAVDASGNTATGTFTVTVKDTTAPVLTVPANVIAAATSPNGAMVLYAAPTAKDAVDPSPKVASSPASGSQFPIGTTTVECTATDASGNVANSSFTVTVKDTTAPILAIPASMTVAAVDASGAVVAYSAPTASDAVDPSPKVASSPASGSLFPIGITAVTCTATDASGNTISRSFTVTVKDSTAPVISCPASMTVAATGPSGAVVTYLRPTAVDNVDPAPQVIADPASGSTFPLGATTVTCTANDASGNVSKASFTITVTSGTDPILNCPADMTVAATSADGAIVNYPAPTVTDPLDPNPQVTSTPASGSLFPIGTTTVNCAATDALGRKVNGSFTITVKDSTAPILTSPANMVVEAVSAGGAVVNYTAPVAKDSVDANPQVTTTPVSGSTFPLGTTTVTCTATDASGNTALATFTITVVDSTVPVLSLPSNMTVTATSANGAVVNYAAPTAADNVDPSPKVTSSPASGSLFPVGVTTVTCTAMDSSGNAAFGSFTITVKSSSSLLPSLAEAVNAPTMNWRTGGNRMWFSQANAALDGYAGQSGAIPVKQSSWMETSMTGPGVLSFWWKVSSEAEKDFLRIYVGSVEQLRISGEVDWVQVNLNIPAGSQPVRWSYTKDGKDAKGAGGQDTAWVDQVSFTPASMAAKASAEPVWRELSHANPGSGASARFITQLMHVEDGSTRLTTWGPAGEECQLQASENLVDWTVIGSGTIKADGTIDFLDSDAIDAAPRYYRAVGRPNSTAIAQN